MEAQTGMETEVFTAAAAAKHNNREKARGSKSTERVRSKNRPHWKQLQRLVGVGEETNDGSATLKVKKRSARHV